MAAAGLILSLSGLGAFSVSAQSQDAAFQQQQWQQNQDQNAPQGSHQQKDQKNQKEPEEYKRASSVEQPEKQAWNGR